MCGEHYSKASISQMLNYLREYVSQWLTCSLEAYYPIIFIDCVHMKGGVKKQELSMWC
ncbi:transposase [uncultured Alistipes sp.]|uniref:transposase n=1 Tax=uncultured Alistipes sp. TaxID=538949 RepID=UPI00345BFC27